MRARLGRLTLEAVAESMGHGWWSCILSLEWAPARQVSPDLEDLTVEEAQRVYNTWWSRYLDNLRPQLGPTEEQVERDEMLADVANALLRFEGCESATVALKRAERPVRISDAQRVIFTPSEADRRHFGALAGVCQASVAGVYCELPAGHLDSHQGWHVNHTFFWKDAPMPSVGP